jgi:SAM-dependent methyltransferase
MEIQKQCGHYGEFRDEQFYFRPAYGKIEFDGERFNLIKSREKKADFYPLSSLHNSLKTRLRFLNLVNKYRKQNDRHLNIGSGVSDYEVFLSRLPIKLYCVEHPSSPVLNEDITKRNIQTTGAQLSTVDITETRLPFEDNFFDSVSFLEVIEHLPIEKLPFVVSEISRVLKKEGYLYLSTPNLASLENRLLLMFKAKLFLFIPQKKEETMFEHLRTYTNNEIRQVFVNFKIIEEIFFTDTITWRTKASFLNIIQSYSIKLLITLNKNFNNSLMFVMQKN